MVRVARLIHAARPRLWPACVRRGLRAVVAAFATDFIGGLIGAVGGTSDFGDAGFMPNGSKVIIGSTINALIYFVIVAAVVYFLLVVPMNKLAERRRRGEPEEATRHPRMRRCCWPRSATCCASRASPARTSGSSDRTGHLSLIASVLPQATASRSRQVWSAVEPGRSVRSSRQA
jgi:uncharacterized membrane protein